MGDSISGRNDFQTSVDIFNRLLDTMSYKNKNYPFILFDKALALIMLDQQENGNLLLKQLCETEKDKTLRAYFCFYLNKTKKDLLTLPPPDHSQATSY
jgi:hypothetical protein